MNIRSFRIAAALFALGLLNTGVALAEPADAMNPVPVAAADASDVAQAGPLSDVPLNSWAYDAVNQLAKDGIIKGYPDGTYKGQRPMTRYEFATLAFRAVDELQSQLVAGKTVDAKLQSDLDAANKLLK